MKNKIMLFVILILLAIAIGVWFFVNYSKKVSDVLPIEIGSKTQVATNLKQYYSAELGLRFAYPSNFFFLEKQAGSQDKKQTTIVLAEDTIENRDLFAGRVTEAREGPTSITIDIYENPKKLKPTEWGKQETTWKLGSQDLQEIIISDQAGVFYDWSGLYQGRSAIITIGDKAYVFSVTWLTENDPTLAAFSKIISTIHIEK